MKLVYRILLHMSWALSLLLAAWAVLFYFTMIDEINDEVDDSLENYAEVLVKRNLAGRELPENRDAERQRHVAARIVLVLLEKRIGVVAIGAVGIPEHLLPYIGIARPVPDRERERRQ